MNRCILYSIYLLFLCIFYSRKSCHAGVHCPRKKVQFVLPNFSPCLDIFKMPHFRHCCAIVLTLFGTISPSQISFQIQRNVLM